MKIEIKEMPIPMITGFTMFAEVKGSAIVEDKFITITADHYTKTRIRTSLKSRDASMGMNWSSDKFKTHYEESYGAFSSELRKAYYFKKIKGQGKEQYIEHVKDMVQKLCKNLTIDKLTIKLIDEVKWT